MSSSTPLHELISSLSRTDTDDDALASVSRHVASITHSDRALIHTLQRGELRLQVEDLHVEAMNPKVVREVVDGALAAGKPGVLAYNPWNPEPRQRNRALTFTELTQINGGITFQVVRDGYPRMGVGTGDNMRMLVCDGQTLLAWVGVFSEDPFTAEQQRSLQLLARPLKKRLQLDLQLSGARLQAAALHAMLEMIAGEAYVVYATPARLRVVMANRCGREALDAEPEGMRAQLRRAAETEGIASPFTVVRLVERGLPEYAVITRRMGLGDRLAERLAVARRQWLLTTRQADVLKRLSRGIANKTIGLELGCAEVTVEKHVTAILQKSGAENRAELVSRFWSLEP